mgnify:CR=1 FL=1
MCGVLPDYQLSQTQYSSSVHSRRAGLDNLSISLGNRFDKSYVGFYRLLPGRTAERLFFEKIQESAIVFIIPGILPLVPGAGMYYTMRELINSNYDKAAATAQTTFFIAGAIALALLMMGSFIKVITSIIHKIK